jgi:catechol 2,3-dioxygenase-like lactoylglutathione lyase family enzyme
MFADMAAMVQKISAVTFRVVSMAGSVRFYRDVLVMEIIYGGEGEFFSSLRAKDAPYQILNLELGEPGDSVGEADFLRGRRGCILGIPARQGISSGESACTTLT